MYALRLLLKPKYDRAYIVAAPPAMARSETTSKRLLVIALRRTREERVLSSLMVLLLSLRYGRPSVLIQPHLLIASSTRYLDMNFFLF